MTRKRGGASRGSAYQGAKRRTFPTIGEATARQRQAFIDRFGREPTADDPVIFDPDEDTPKPLPESKLTAQMVLTMIRAGSPEHLIYAYIRTEGLILSAEGLRKASAEDRKAWDQAMTEYQKHFGA